MIKNDDIIAVRGNKDLWMDFMYVLRKNKLKPWTILESTIKEYIENNKDVLKI